MKIEILYLENVGRVSVSIFEICVRLSMPVVFSSLQLHQPFHPADQLILVFSTSRQPAGTLGPLKAKHTQKHRLTNKAPSSSQNNKKLNVVVVKKHQRILLMT